MRVICLNETDDSLDIAQVNKLEYIAKGLSLGEGAKPGCRVRLGGTIRYFIEAYGTESVGITNSPVQAEYGTEKRNRVQQGDADILCGDFSQFLRLNQYDAITVVGMLEHVESITTRRVL